MFDVPDMEGFVLKIMLVSKSTSRALLFDHILQKVLQLSFTCRGRPLGIHITIYLLHLRVS